MADAYYKVCEFCGAHLDPGEKCDCRIVDDCDYCAYKKSITSTCGRGECYVCRVRHKEFKNSMFLNELIVKADRNGSKRRIGGW